MVSASQTIQHGKWLEEATKLWPWSLALLLAVLGGGAALAPLMSLWWVAPLDQAGNPTPAWSLKIHLALVVVATTALPALAVLVAGTRARSPALAWVAAPVAALTALLLLAGAGAAATHRLRARQHAVLRRLT